MQGASKEKIERKKVKGKMISPLHPFTLLRFLVPDFRRDRLPGSEHRGVRVRPAVCHSEAAGAKMGIKKALKAPSRALPKTQTALRP